MTTTVGVILAGGQASRMGNLDKPLLLLKSKPIIQHVIDLARPQADQLAISVNRNLDSFRHFDLPLITDLPATPEGPLIGIYSAMHWFHEQSMDADYLACFPADVPVFPRDLVSQLKIFLRQTMDSQPARQRSRDTVAWCQTGDQVQPLFSLWPFTVLQKLEKAIDRGIHGPRLFFRDHPNVTLVLPPARPPQFFNINTPEQLREAGQLLDGNLREN